MIGWILGRVSAKAILVTALVSLGLNVGQFTWHKVTSGHAKITKDYVQLAVNNALQTQKQAQDSQLLKEKDSEIERLKQKTNDLDLLVEDKIRRGDRWKHDALKFKKYYEERCKDDDEECKAWGSDAYRGDG